MNIGGKFQEEVNLKEKVNTFVFSVNELSKKLNGDIYGLRFLLTQCVKDVPKVVDAGLNSNKQLSRRKHLAVARESLEQCKNYLSMLKSMNIVSTSDLIHQVEEINKMLEK
ncbi:MAG: hypothetical protein CH6_1773 [Candidatus Kapaibacterium sp.]|jgi:hypothetical protein|nr:MAG: hypothetical protein CH6_1773 [Candidatus Kapabacteria bacterium]ROL57878.1 MAG: hypothetical protein D9V84_03950 [Bacteroidetes/Chlorobi group bacterium Naka2016]